MVSWFWVLFYPSCTPTASKVHSCHLCSGTVFQVFFKNKALYLSDFSHGCRHLTLVCLVWSPNPYGPAPVLTLPVITVTRMLLQHSFLVSSPESSTLCYLQCPMAIPECTENMSAMPEAIHILPLSTPKP